MKVLITGASGFIGFHISLALLQNGQCKVIGIDNMNDYYDIDLKEARLSRLLDFDSFVFYKVSLEEKLQVDKIFESHTPDFVINLAAQAGVRYSIRNPHAFINSNISGFLNILEACCKCRTQFLIYASSSSVYGTGRVGPFFESQETDKPISIYAATKKTNELMAYVYSHMYGLPTFGLRFFTVYGPWGRPDMAIFSFANSIFAQRPISLYNRGVLERDFTYISDVVDGILKIIEYGTNLSTNSFSPNDIPHHIYNIGSNHPRKVLDIVKILESKIGIRAIIHHEEMQPGDVLCTHSNMDLFEKKFDFRCETSLEHGISNFIDWYRSYYQK